LVLLILLRSKSSVSASSQATPASAQLDAKKTEKRYWNTGFSEILGRRRISAFFKIEQIELIREIQKIPTTLVSESFWMKILPLNSR
jgi:hypothetical protein